MPKLVVRSAMVLLMICSSARASITFSTGATASGAVTAFENFQSYSPFDALSSPFVTPTGFTFTLSGSYGIEPPNFVALPSQALYQLYGPIMEIKLTSGEDIAAMQLDIGNGFNAPIEDVWIRAYENGVFTGYEYQGTSVPTGTFTITSNGTAFNEIHVVSSGSMFLDFTSESAWNGAWAVSVDDVTVFGSSSAVPEPSSFALLGLGCVGSAFGAYRRGRCAASA